MTEAVALAPARAVAYAAAPIAAVGGVNPSLTIQAITCRTGDRIKQLAARGELATPSRKRALAHAVP